MSPLDETIATSDEGLVPLDRRVLVLWRIRTGIAVALVALGVGALALAAGGATPGLVALAAVSLVGMIVSWLWTDAVWRGWRFVIGDDALHVRHGVLTRREATIPLHRVQHIDLEAGPLERRLGIATFVLRTAAAGSDSTVPGIDAADADEVRARILARAGHGDAV